MTPIYNQYLKATKDEKYSSEILFINTNKPVVEFRTFYVEFEKSLNKKSGFYLDNNDYLKNLYYKIRQYDTSLDNETLHLKYSNNLITNVSSSLGYYSYIKVITDTKNPQLEGQIMILKYGRKISYKIAEYINSEKYYHNTFKINIELVSVYPNYDGSYFTNKELEISDDNLDIESEIFFKQINIKAIEREEKLKHLKTEIELKEFRYQEYIKLKEEFENEK